MGWRRKGAEGRNFVGIRRSRCGRDREFRFPSSKHLLVQWLHFVSFLLLPGARPLDLPSPWADVDMLKPPTKSSFPWSFLTKYDQTVV